MIAGLMKPIEKVLKLKTPRSRAYYYGEARCAAKLVFSAHGTDILGGPSLGPILDLLRIMRADDEWLDDWKDKTTVIAALNKEIAAVRRVMRTCCEKKRS
jgi:hypothetical protein